MKPEAKKKPAKHPRKKFWMRLFERFQRRCPHKREWVRPDILDGDVDGQCVHWCLRCGAYRRVWTKTGSEREWSVPMATWAERWPRN